ncbi:hypothetical protein [Aliiroseovarius sediminis]|nr:hypothetical protein [Aliiroseovarius sediminis]MCI2395720.1 hypothetical protein [Aliiroseovarius sediminis]
MAKGVGVITSDRPVVIVDDDRFYMASVLAEFLANAGLEVTFVTPTAVVSPWSENTLEQDRIQRRLVEKNVAIMPLNKLADMSDETLTLACTYTGATHEIACGKLVMVTSRTPNDALWHGLEAVKDRWADAGRLPS